MNTKLVLAVGNSLMGDDDAGPWLARRMQASPVAGWDAIDGGSVPENHLHQVRESRPKLVAIVDAAEMDLAPGEIRLLDEQAILSGFLLTTHNLPLSFLIRALREFVPQVVCLGIQPGSLAFANPLSPCVQTAVEEIYQGLLAGRDLGRYRRLAANESGLAEVEGLGAALGLE